MLMWNVTLTRLVTIYSSKNMRKRTDRCAVSRRPEKGLGSVRNHSHRTFLCACSTEADGVTWSLYQVILILVTRCWDACSSCLELLRHCTFGISHVHRLFSIFTYCRPRDRSLGCNCTVVYVMFCVRNGAHYVSMITSSEKALPPVQRSKQLWGPKCYALWKRCAGLRRLFSGETLGGVWPPSPISGATVSNVLSNTWWNNSFMWWHIFRGQSGLHEMVYRARSAYIQWSWFQSSGRVWRALGTTSHRTSPGETSWIVERRKQKKHFHFVRQGGRSRL